MKILVVNPNRVRACTEAIATAARDAIEPIVEIHTVQPTWGPVELAGDLEVMLSACGVLDRIWHSDGYDAVVLAGFGEPGLEAAREIAGVPVIDITEAGTALALTIGRRYGIVTSTPGAVSGVRDRLKALGMDSRCSGVSATGLGVPELAGDSGRPPATIRAIAATARYVVADGADVIVLGCGGMAGLAAEVGRLVGVPVVDAVTAGVVAARYAGQCHPALGRIPRRPAVPQWPLTSADDARRTGLAEVTAS